MNTPVECILDLLEADNPDPATLAGLRRYANGYGTLPEALGLHQHSRGLRDAVRHARVRRAIIQAAGLLPTESTAYSKAKVLRSELLRLLRTWPRCTARSRMDELLLNVIEAADGNPPTGPTSIRDVIANGQ